MNFRQATSADTNGILQLQSKYLFANLTAEERKEGFVTTPFTPELIAEAMNLDGVFVAETTGNQIVGYAYAASWHYFMQWQMFVYMATLLPDLTFKGQQLTLDNTFQYGPVCIDKPFRGGETFPKLFETMRQNLKKRYPISVTFINVINERSFRAHTKKLGWEVLTEFEFNQNRYYFLGLEIRRFMVKNTEGGF